MSSAPINSIADIVRVHGANRPQHPCLTEGSRTLDWAEMYERSQRVAQGLAAAGVGSGDRVALLDMNGVPHFEIAFGAALVNAVSVDVNWRLAAPEVEYIVNNAEAKVLVVGAEFVAILDAIADKLQHTKLILVVGGHGKYEDWNTWLERQPTGDPHAPSGMDDVAFQLYSSGTTGLPKGVMLTNKNFLAIAPMIEAIWELKENSVNLAAMPLFHIGGGGWAMAGMYKGCSTIILRTMDPAALVKLFGQKRITHAFLVPAVLAFMNMIPGVENEDFSSLEVMVYGASPISEEVLTKSVQLLKCKFWQAYGLTETTGGICNLPRRTTTRTARTSTASAAAACRGPAWRSASSTTTTTATARWARSARSGAARTRTCSGTGSVPRTPRRPSPRTAGSRPVTPATSTPTDTSSSMTA